MSDTAAREALRQQLLLRVIWHDAPAEALAGWSRDGARLDRGLQAYEAHAGALAERALAAAYPTVRQLVGAEPFAALARAFWRRVPPLRGDVSTWGDGLAAFIDHDAKRAGDPYLADVARLEWAVHRAHGAADGPAGPVDLQSLAAADADTDLEAVRLVAHPGTAWVESAHPIVGIWQAHQDAGNDRFGPVRAALAAGHSEWALVWRRGWRVQVGEIADGERAFTRAILQGLPLGPALDAADDRFDFSAWLVGALRRGWLAGVCVEDRVHTGAAGDRARDGGTPE